MKEKSNILEVHNYLNSNNIIKSIILSFVGKSCKYKYDSVLVKLSCLIMSFTPLFLFFNKKSYILGICGFLMVFFSYISDTYFCLFKTNVRKLFVFLDMFFTTIYIIFLITFILLNYENTPLLFRIFYCILGLSYFIFCAKIMLQASRESKSKNQWEIRHSIWHLYLTTINFIFIYLFDFSQFKKNILLDIILFIFIILHIISILLYNF